MTKDKRSKGCPNEECERHIKKIKLKSTEEYCPKCGTKLVYVCAKCFDEIEDLDESHRICSACEAESLERKEKAKAQAKKAAGGVGKVAVGVVGPVVVGVVGIVKKDGQKKAIEAGAEIAKKVLKI